MSKNITFFVASNTGGTIQKITLSRKGVFLLGLVIAAVVGVLGYILIDYISMKRTAFNTDYIRRQFDSQTEEISVQRKQIQLFASEINALKNKLVDLNEFEQKIRIIANIEDTVEQNTVFGVGGVVPEDLDANVILTEKHNSLVREMHEQIGQLNVVSSRQEDGFKSLMTYLEEQRNLLASTPAISPTKGWVTSRFGYRKSPFTGLREFHKGLDIASRTGTPVIATADGVVTFSGSKGLLGKMLAIDHGHGMVTRYAHLHRALKKRGDPVSRGDVIAEVGNTGRSTGPHLHYDVRLNGISVNPEKYILN